MSTNIGVNGAPSVSSQTSENLTSEDNHSTKVVGDTFVQQYYTILKQCPEDTYKFYKDESTVSRPYIDGSMRVVETIQDIDDEIMGSDIKNWDTQVLAVHAQDTIEESIIVGVVGSMTKNNLLKFFSQTFLLAPQATGFYVHNDLFQFINISSLNITPPVPESSSNTTEDATEVTYASIVTKGSSLPSPAPHCENPTSPPNNAKDTTTEATPEVLKEDEDDANKESFASIVTNSISLPIPQQASQHVPAKPVAVCHNVKTILIKDVPPQATRRTLTHAVKAYGSVKHRNIQIRKYGDGYRYAFVEFNDPKSARLAVEAGTIMFGDWESQVEPKKAQMEGAEHCEGSDHGSDDGGSY